MFLGDYLYLALSSVRYKRKNNAQKQVLSLDK
jgi:hypothetical protein